MPRARRAVENVGGRLAVNAPARADVTLLLYPTMDRSHTSRDLESDLVSDRAVDATRPARRRAAMPDRP
jgi:hypothetical protein